MKKKINFFSFFGLAFVSAFAVGGMTFAFADNAADSLSSAQSSVKVEARWEIAEFDSDPVYGTEMNMPAATAEIGGKKISAEAYVVYPDGNAYVGDSFSVSSAGKYTVIFYAEVDGKFAKTERSFVVDAPFVSYGTSSSCSYGEYTKFGSETNNAGYMLRIGEGDTVVFNKLIDIDAAKNNSLIDLFICPDGETADFEKLTLKFTDASDSDVYLTVTLNRVDSGAWEGSNTCQYVKAAGNGQALTGIEGYGSSSEKVHVDNDYGTCINVPFDARNNDAGKTMLVPSAYSMRLLFDADNNVLKANGLTVTDLDNPDYYSSLWSGFPSGKAKLSVSASGYNSKTANICIRKIFGLDFSDEFVTDVTPPEIVIDTDYDTMPKAQTGTAYSVPSATANDDYLGACDVFTKVIYAKGTANEYSVPYENGFFTPTAAGEYTIVYSAADGYGNLSEKELKVVALRQVEPITIEMPSYPEYNYGEYLEIKSAVVSGCSGSAIMQIRVCADGEEVTVTEGKVKLDRVAKWTVEYTVTDYLGRTKSAAAEIETNISATPIFSQTPVLPAVMIEGSAYTIDEFYAEQYTADGKRKILCDVTIIDGAGEHTMKSGNKYVPSISESEGRASIRFSADGTYSETVYEIPVVRAKSTDSDGYATVDMSRYFYGDDIEATATTSGVTIKTKKSGDVGWTFANALLSETFSIEIAKTAAKSWGTGIRIVLTDAYDENNIAVADLSVRKSGTVLKSGKNEAVLSSDLYSSASASVTVSYKDGAFKVGNVSVAAGSESGRTFEGFSKRKVFLQVLVLGAEEESEYEVRTISLHRFNNETEDYTVPAIYIDGKYGGSFDLGSVCALPAAYAGDVLAPNTSITLTVLSPSGKIVKDANGHELNGVEAGKEYRISLDEYGQYKIRYTAAEVDWFDLDKTMQYLINVDDGTPPTITIGETVKQAQTGDIFELPSISVADDRTTERDISVWVCVYNPQGKIISMTEKYFRFETTGVYEFRIIAVDEAGNTALKTFKVTVGEK